MPSKPEGAVRLVCMSDTHTLHEKFEGKIPDGDIFVHSGDFTVNGGAEETDAFIRWIASLNFKAKIVVGGNHDGAF